MIVFKQLPLNNLETFEDELLFLLAGTVLSIIGFNEYSRLQVNVAEHLCITYEPDIVDNMMNTIDLFRVAKLCGKYGKTFNGLFEIKLIQQLNGRYKLNIQENMEEVSEDVKEFIDK